MVGGWYIGAMVFLGVLFAVLAACIEARNK